MKSKIPYIFLTIILITGFGARLYKVKNPIGDWHSWRQADTSAVTRNFQKFGVDLLHPRYDDFTDVSGKGLYNPKGYRFVEFPIFNVVHLSFASLFPQLSLEVWGRLTSALSAVVSAVLLYFIVTRHTNYRTGLLASFFYLMLPYNIYFTRVILPDPLMVTLYLAALNFFDMWTKKPKLGFFIGAAITASLAVLVKPVAVFFLLPMYWQLWKKYGFGVIRTKWAYFLTAAILIPFGLWRLWMLQYPEGIPANGWLLNGNKIRFKGAFFRWIFGERIGSLILGNWGVLPLGMGVISAAAKQGYFLTWVGAALLYLFTFATGNVHHDYYQIPIIPSLSVMVALGVMSLFKSEVGFLHTWTKRGIAVMAVAFTLAFSWYNVRGNYQINHWEIIHAGQAADRLLPKDAVVIAPYMGDTAFLYQTNRPGFPYVYMPVKDLRDRYNAWYYISVNYDAQTNDIMNKYIVLEKTPEYVIVKLEEPIRP